jgi:hypothetical protein
VVGHDDEALGAVPFRRPLQLSLEGGQQVGLAGARLAENRVKARRLVRLPVEGEDVPQVGPLRVT